MVPDLYGEASDISKMPANIPCLADHGFEGQDVQKGLKVVVLPLDHYSGSRPKSPYPEKSFQLA